MTKKASPITIREFVSQEDIDKLLESAFLEQAEAADELELELSDLAAENTLFDTVLDDDAELISNEDIEALLKGTTIRGTSPAGDKRAGVNETAPAVSEAEESEGMVSQADIDALLSGGLDGLPTQSSSAAEAEAEADFEDLISQGDLDSLLSGALADASSPESMGGESTDNSGGLISQGDIDTLLREAMAETAGEPDFEGGGISQADINSLIESVESETEKADIGDLVSQSGIDALLGGPAKPSDAKAAFKPAEPTKDGGEVISQKDLDALLMQAMDEDNMGSFGSADAEGREEGAESEQTISQSAIDSLLAENPIAEPSKKASPPPEPVILAADSDAAEDLQPAESARPRPWYARRVYQISVVAVLVLSIAASAVFIKLRRSGLSVTQPVVLHFPIPGPDAKAPALTAPISTNISLVGFLILAPLDNSGMICISTDVMMVFSDNTMAGIIKDNEPFVRNVIYGVINTAALASAKKPINEAELALAVREALERVVPKEAIRSVLLDKFEIIS